MKRSAWMGLTGTAVLWVGLSSAACGGGGTGGSGGGSGGGTTTGTGTTPEAACDDFSSAVCAKLDACLPLLLAIQFGDVATCSARDALACANYFDLPGVSATPAEFSACAAAYAAVSCDDLLNGKIPAACEAIQHGTTAEGQPCAENLECASASCHKAEVGDSCGVCAHVGAVGDACDPDLGGDCAGSAYCAPTAKKCAALTAGKGDACNDDVHCLSPYYCASSGVCAEHVGEGQPCDPMQNDCDAFTGLFCSSANLCKKIKLAGPGEACGFDAASGDITGCKAQGNCNTDMTGKGVCAAPTADGAACTADPMEPDPCTAPARCVGDVCSLATPTCQ